MSATREDFLAALGRPGFGGWGEILSYGSRVLRDNNTAQIVDFLATARARLKAWPAELARPCPKHWPAGFRGGIEYKIPEIKVYGIYTSRIGSDPRLRCSDGLQAVRLKNRSLHSAYTRNGTPVQLEDEGAFDLQGGMILESFSGKRIEVVVELDVKTFTGRVEEAQELRLNAVRRRGGVAAFVETVEDAVLFLVEERGKLQRVLI